MRLVSDEEHRVVRSALRETLDDGAIRSAGRERVEALQVLELELLAEDLGRLLGAHERTREHERRIALETREAARGDLGALRPAARQRARGIVGPARSVAAAGGTVPEEIDPHGRRPVRVPVERGEGSGRMSRLEEPRPAQASAGEG